MTPSDMAHHLDTLRRYIDETETVLAECKAALSRGSTLTNGDVVDNARTLYDAAQALRYWIGRRLRA